jgi:hypothetical protein
MLPKPTPFEPNPFLIRPSDTAIAASRYTRKTKKTARTSPPDPGSVPHKPKADQPTSADQKADPAARRGPPVNFDEEKRILFCELIRHGFTKGKAARLLAVAPRTVQETAQNDPEFAEWVREANLELHAHSAANIARAGRKNWRAAAWLLDRAKLRRGPGRPRTRSLLLTDPLFRRDMKQLVKQLVRDVLAEVMPELRQDIAGPRAVTHASLASSPPSPSVSPPLPRTSAQTKARQFTDGVPAPSSQTPLPQTLAPPHTNGHARITAQNP